MPFSYRHRESLGSAVLATEPTLVAGSQQAIRIIYTAGLYGIDETGAIKVSWRTASDSAIPQFTDPGAANYCTARCSSGASLRLSYSRNNIRPWSNTLLIRIEREPLRCGDQVVLDLGPAELGCPGYRVQTCADDEFEFRVFVDPFATYEFAPLPVSPTIRIVPGPVAAWRAVLPSLRIPGEPFSLSIVAEDRWGNPTSEAEGTIILRSDLPVRNLPDTVPVRRGDTPLSLDGLTCSEPGTLRIRLFSPDGDLLALSNPLRIGERPAGRGLFWGDLHGQSGETVGTNSIERYFEFARDKAFLDIAAHQANDFQVSDAFWAKINATAAAFDDPGTFVVVPGYEWSGNTGVGGDRNVFFRREGRPIYRSSAALLPPDSSDGNICPTGEQLFDALRDEDAVVIAHVGGRYADIGRSHCARLETAVEIHSSWGTFEWLLHDAFDLGYRVGVVCHSDDHKGRPGAAYPGAATFGAVGGLTCYQLERLDRANLFACLRARRHYGTTGARILLDVRASEDADPAQAGGTNSGRGGQPRPAGMGEILTVGGRSVRLHVDVAGTAPIERITIFNGKSVAAVRAESRAADGHRIRVVFEGAERRGRSRAVRWNGSCRLTEGRFTRAVPFNFFNKEAPLQVSDDGRSVGFDCVTTGNFAGFDLYLEDGRAGSLVIASSVLSADLRLADISGEDTIFSAGGLGKGLRVFRMSDQEGPMDISFDERVELSERGDNPIYVRVTQEDGHQAWSSPIYVARTSGA